MSIAASNVWIFYIIFDAVFHLRSWYWSFWSKEPNKTETLQCWNYNQNLLFLYFCSSSSTKFNKVNNLPNNVLMSSICAESARDLKRNNQPLIVFSKSMLALQPLHFSIISTSLIPQSFANETDLESFFIIVNYYFLFFNFICFFSEFYMSIIFYFISQTLYKLIISAL